MTTRNYLPDLDAWKKGVEDANRISQRERERERAERAEAALEAGRARTDALYDVLGAARGLLAVFLREEHAGRAFVRGAPISVLEVSGALQRLRDTLHETRGTLLRLPGAGGGERTGPKDDAARANAASGRERPAAPGRTGDATGEAIAGEMAPAGPGALASASHCPKSQDGRHVDAGGPFFFSCRLCGWADEYPGDQG